MGFLRDLFNNRKKQKETEEEKKFNNMPLQNRYEMCERELGFEGKKDLERLITKKPYMLPYMIADLDVDNLEKLVDIATKKNVDIDNLIGKSSVIPDETIVNIAVKNKPELVLELDTRKDLQNMITTDTLIEAFTKDPNVIYSDCAALDAEIKVKGIDKDGNETERKLKLKPQLQRAMNLYFRPEAMRKNGFDDYAKSIADRIDTNLFMAKIFSNKMTTRSTTAANEMLKQNPEKASVAPAKTLHNWNNRVLHTVPNQARKIKNAEVRYNKYKDYLLGLLENSALNSFTKEERKSLLKKCVLVAPDLYYSVSVNKLYNDIFEDKKACENLQYLTYKAYKLQKRPEAANEFLAELPEENQKRVMSKFKATATRKANRNAEKEAIKTEEPQTL